MKVYLTLDNFDPKRTVVFLDPHYRKNIFDLLLKKFGSRKNIKRFLGCKSDHPLSAIEKGFISRARNLKTKQGIPLKTIIKISEYFRFPNLKEIEKHICYIKRKGPAKIIPINLPLLLNPQIFSFIAHMIADGSALDNNTHYYKNTNSQLLYSFISEMESCFPNLGLEKKGDIVIVPNIFIKTLSKKFNFKAGTFESSVPRILFTLPNLCSINFIRAFFDDEGSVSDTRFVAYSFNKILLEGVRLLLTKKLNINKGVTLIRHRKKGKGIEYSFAIGSKSILQYTSKVGSFHSIKAHRLGCILNRRMKVLKQNPKGVTKKLILNSLQKKSMTNREISEELFITVARVNDHLKELIDRDDIYRERFGGMVKYTVVQKRDHKV